MISCADAIRQLWAYLEQEVSPADRAAVEAHLQVCRRCCGEAEFIEQLEGLLSRNATPDLPADVRARMEGFMQALEGLDV